MPQKTRLIQLPLVGKVFLCVLAIVYLGYLVGLVNYLSTSTSNSAIVDHQLTNLDDSLKHWTVTAMRNADDVDELSINTFDQTTDFNLQQASIDTGKTTAGQQPGQPPTNGDSSFPITTVGKVFFSDKDGRDYVCSGTSVISNNHNVVDTAGHCLYWNGSWMQNVIFCPQYDSGNTPFGCWAARELVAPADWLNAGQNDFHHDFGMAIVAPNSQGNLTDMVGGVGWAYNQSTELTFYAYGYPAGHPFDGQTRKSCEERAGKGYSMGSGTVIAIPCDMTGGSSGGPWFIKVDGNWYVNGHNDFVSSARPGHMFSPYYDDTWFALYKKAQDS